MRRRKRPNWALRLCLLGILLVFAIHVIVIPVVGLAIAPAPGSQYEESLQQHRFLGSALQRATEFFVGFWFLFLGSAIGSFLNVVVYRMPIGKSIAAKGSYCPNCRVSIRSYDNIPVLGWIKLRGRCRACRLPIASRYPIVEAFVGVLFFVLYLIEVSSGGLNLPGIQNASGYGISPIVLNSRWDVLAMFCFHAVLISTLVSASLIRYDGSQVPKRLVVFGIVTAGIMAIGWPDVWRLFLRAKTTVGSPIESLYPVNAFSFESIERFDHPALQAATTFVFGVIAGGAIGWLIGTISSRAGYRDPRGEYPRRSLFLGMAMIGAYVGWQGVLSVGTLMLIGLLLAQFVAILFAVPQRIPLLAWASMSAYVQILMWNVLFSIQAWPGSTNDWRWLIPQVIGLGFACVILGLIFARRTHLPGDSHERIPLT